MQIQLHAFDATQAAERGGASSGGCAWSACGGGSAPLVSGGSVHGRADGRIYEVPALVALAGIAVRPPAPPSARPRLKMEGHHRTSGSGDNVCGQPWGCLDPLRVAGEH